MRRKMTWKAFEMKTFKTKGNNSMQTENYSFESNKRP